MPTIMDWVERITGFTLPEEMYFVDKLSADMEPLVVLSILASSFVLSIIAPLYPAFKAAGTNPARALAYE